MADTDPPTGPKRTQPRPLPTPSQPHTRKTRASAIPFPSPISPVKRICPPSTTYFCSNSWGSIGVPVLPKTGIGRSIGRFSIYVPARTIIAFFAHEFHSRLFEASLTRIRIERRFREDGVAPMPATVRGWGCGAVRSWRTARKRGVSGPAAWTFSVARAGEPLIVSQVFADYGLRGDERTASREEMLRELYG